MAVKVSVNLSNISRLRDKLKNTNLKCYVGVNQDDGAAQYGGGKATVAEVATYQEFGWVQRVTAKQSGFFRHEWGIGLPRGAILVLPPRPFMRATFAERAKDWATVFKNALESGQMDFEDSLSVVGQVAVSDIQKTINDGGIGTTRFKERSELTMRILEAKARGHTRDGTGAIDSRKALGIDSLLLHSITYKISK